MQGLWIGPRLSTMQRLTICSYLANGHPFHLHTYEDVKGVPEGTTLRDAREILPEAEICTYQDGFGKGSPSLFSNFFRYKLLFERGGYWSDMDMVCLRPLRFDQEYVFGQQLRPDGTTMVNVALMKAPAGSPVMRRCWEHVAAADRNALRWGQVGPRLMDDAVAKEDLRRFVLPVEVFYPIHHPRFADLLTNIELPAESHALHLWGALWKHHGIDPDATHASDSLYERLKRRYLHPASAAVDPKPS